MKRKLEEHRKIIKELKSETTGVYSTSSESNCTNKELVSSSLETFNKQLPKTKSNAVIVLADGVDSDNDIQSLGVELDNPNDQEEDSIFSEAQDMDVCENSCIGDADFNAEYSAVTQDKSILESLSEEGNNSSSAMLMNIDNSTNNYHNYYSFDHENAQELAGNDGFMVMYNS